MSSDIIQKAETYVKQNFQSSLSAKYTYHNFEHTLKVKNAIQALTTHTKLTDSEIEPLILAALFHDLGICRSLDEHENESKQLAENFLKDQNYSREGIKTVLDIIEATKMDHDPKNQFEGLIKDADLCGLADDNYLEESEKLRHEWEYLNGKVFEDKEWNHINYQFMKEHEYHTEEARALYGSSKERNMALLEEVIQKEKSKKKKKKKKTPSPSTISSSKSAQTQFKTALRNHIDLSSIADNKANIMLSVNALIITVALPVIAGQVIGNPALLIPAVILLIVCVSSMIYATLATRPIKMKGYVSREEIESKRSNLFFFGNFYNMSFDDYSAGIDKVVSDQNILDNSITRDLFFLGKALGAKYRNLRFCYNIFMFGIIVVVIAFTIAFIVSSTGN